LELTQWSLRDWIFFTQRDAEGGEDAEGRGFLKTDGGWLILNLHGLDEEGWGPISAAYLDKLLQRLSRIDQLAVLPTGAALP